MEPHELLAVQSMTGSALVGIGFLLLLYAAVTPDLLVGLLGLVFVGGGGASLWYGVYRGN